MNDSLRFIKLGKNQIGDQGAKALAGALCVNKFLISINFYDNRIGKEGAKALAKALHINKSLASIDLSWNLIDDEGAKALAEALRVNKSLTLIDLAHNRITESGRKALVDALHVNFTILIFDLDFTFEVGVAKLIERNKSLRWQNQHGILLNMCIAMQSFDLPAYVLLWIYNQFGLGEASINQFKKISLIESVINSIRSVKRVR